MSSIKVEQDRGVARVCMQRPAVHNAFDDKLIRELTVALAELGRDVHVRAVVLTGAGASFSAGADLGWMRRMAQATEDENRADAQTLAQLMHTLAFLPKPTLARVNGAAYGGGVGLVACCDIAIASVQAKFALTEVRLGLVPAVISPYVIDAIGTRQALRWFQTGEAFDAARAQAIGLVHEVVEADALDAAIDAQTAALLKGGPHAVLAAKQLAQRMGARLPDRRRLADEENAALIARMRVSQEGQEGITAFLEKRKSSWLAS